jgi:hypothetical protein
MTVRVPRPQPRAADYAIRPWLRWLAAILMLALAYVSVEGALHLLQEEGVVYGYRSCGRGKGWWLCELGNLIASWVSSSVRGVVEGVSGFIVAGFWLFVAWLLLRPVVRRPTPKA